VLAQARVVEQHPRTHQRACERTAPSLVGACDEPRIELAIEPKKPLPGRSSHAGENSAAVTRYPQA